VRLELLYLPAAALGIAIVVGTLLSAVKTIVLPRAEVSQISRLHFLTMRKLFDVLARPSLPFARRDRVYAWYAPLGLLLLPGLWVVLVMLGFTLIYWGTWDGSMWQSFETSGSSLLTLGFLKPDDHGHVALTFVEATLGLGLVGLLISYLPTIYGAFNRREQAVALLEGRAGTPPTPATLLTRYRRIGWLDEIDDELFPLWELWFADVEESHTSQPALVFFRSPNPARSWLTAAGCVLDTASLLLSVVDVPRSPKGQMTIRTGFFALRRIADYFGIPYDIDPKPDDPITVTQAEFDEVCAELEAAGVPLKTDRAQAWRDFAGWRVNYDAVLVALCALVVTPPGKWSTDRAAPRPKIDAITRGRARRRVAPD
jgi:hypothetical protein